MADETPVKGIDYKSFYQSKTFWGLFISGASFIASKVLNFDLDPVFQSTAVNTLTDIGTAIGGLVAAWGLRAASVPVGKPKA